jgi:hypothetical protein
LIHWSGTLLRIRMNVSGQWMKKIHINSKDLGIDGLSGKR